MQPKSDTQNWADYNSRTRYMTSTFQLHNPGYFKPGTTHKHGGTRD